MNSFMLGEIISSMEFLIARLADKLLLPFVLARVTQPVVFPDESLSTRVASESITKGENKNNVKLAQVKCKNEFFALSLTV